LSTISGIIALRHDEVSLSTDHGCFQKAQSGLPPRYIYETDTKKEEKEKEKEKRKKKKKKMGPHALDRHVL
jgi:hypothetical protein